MQAIRSPVSTTWLQSPDESDRLALLEYTRGVLYGSAFIREDGGTKNRAIHVSRIQNAFSNLGAPTLYKLGLRLLQLFREVEPLFGGYWALTPYRVIEIETHLAFIGSVPSVSGKLGEIKLTGLGRFISDDVASQFPRQELTGWMGSLASPLEMQVKVFVSSHYQQAAPALQADDIEYLNVLGAGRHGRRYSWGWQPHAVLASEKIALCRQKHLGAYRYFSGEIHAGTLKTEAPIGHPLARIMFALANHIGHPVVARVRQEGNTTLTTVTEHLPSEAYRLALLLATDVSRQGYTTTYSIESSHAPALHRQLVSLGCYLESSK